MKLLIASAATLGLLLLSCKQPVPVASQLDRLKTAQSNSASNGGSDEYSGDATGGTTDSASNGSSAMDTMANDIQLALVSDGGLSAADASMIISSGKSSMTSTAATKLDASSLAALSDHSAQFFAAVEQMLHSDKVKISDMDKVLKATGAALVSALRRAYESEAKTSLKLDSAPSWSDPALVKMVADVIGNMISHQNAANRVGDVGSLLQGIVKGVAAQGLTTAQISAILGSVSASVAGLSAKDLPAADLQKLASEAAKSLMSGVSGISGMTATDLATHIQMIVQETVKAIASGASFDKNTIPDLIHAIAAASITGSGSVAKIDADGIVLIAKALVQGIVGAIKALDPLNYIALADKIVSEAVAGVKEGVAKIPGLDEKAIDGLHIDPNDILAQLSAK